MRRAALLPLGLLLLGLILCACSALNASPPPPAVPTELIPTFIVQTLNARRQSETPPASPTDPAPLDTPTPSLTSIAGVTANPTETTTPQPASQTPAAGLDPRVTPRPPTRTPTITPTPNIPNASIQIQAPGPGSKVTSPLRLKGWARSGSDNRLRIELFGEDGRLLVRKIVSYIEANKYVYFEEKVDFEIPGVAEAGRLVISTYDTSGRLVSLAARDLLLLSLGDEEITQPGDLSEPVVVAEPILNKLIQGGTLQVSGLVRPFNDQPMLVELTARDGTQKGYRQFFALPDPAGGYVAFAVQVPYKVDRLTPVLMTIKAYSNSRISGIIYTISEEIILSP